MPTAVESFNYVGAVAPVENQVIFYGDVEEIDVSDVFISPNGDVTVDIESNSDPSIAEISLDGNILTITAQSVMGQTTVTLLGSDGILLDNTSEFYVTVLDPNPNTQTLEIAIEDTPEQQNYPNNANPYENTLTDLGWTTVTVEEDEAIISMHITGDLFSDNYPSEGSLWMTSPDGVTVEVSSGFESGTNVVDFEVSDFIAQSCNGDWDIYFEDSYGDGGHALYNGTLVIEIAGSGAPVVAPENLVAEVTEDDVHLEWDYENSGGETFVLAWDSGVNDDGIGLTNGGSFLVASRWTATELVSYHTMPITSIRFFPRDASTTYTLKVWTGADAGTEVVSMPLTDLVMEDWNEIVLDTPVVIDASDELWFGYACDNQPAGGYPAGCDAGPAVAGFGDMISTDGATWDPLSGFGLDYNWNIQATVNGRVMERHAIPEAIEVAMVENELFSQGNLTPEIYRDRALLGFKVYRDEVEISYLEDTEAREYDDMDLADGTYEYYVTAVYDTTESNPSNIVEAIINTNTELTPPSNVSVTGGGYVTWDEPGAGEFTILLVDDDGSIDLGFTDTVPYYEAILDASGINYEVYEITTAGNDGPDAAYMSNYDIVIWDCGEQWASSRTLTITDESELASYLDNGGYLILNAHDYFYDRYPNAGAFSAGQFPYDYLGIGSAIQDAFTVGESQGGPASVEIMGAGATDGMMVQLQDIFSAMRDGVYLDYLTPNSMGSLYSTHNGSTVGIQTSNTIYTTAGWPGLIDGDNTVLEYVLASFAHFTAMRPLEYYMVYLDGVYQGDTTETNFQLTGLTVGQTYTVGVTAVYTEGESEAAEASFTYTGTASDQNLIGVTALSGNYPNPFNPESTISFSVANTSEVNITIYNVRGQKIKTLVNEMMDAGNHSVVWKGTDNNGKKAASGIYYYKMKSGKFTSSKKMVLMK